MKNDAVNKNCISYWFPKLQASGVDVPKTELITGVSREILHILDGKETPELIELSENIVAAGNRLGWPCFLRGGEYSGKHSWNRTCHVPSADVVRTHLCRIIEDGECSNLMGFAWDVFAVREFIPPHAMSFICEGYEGLPIRRERRAFIEDGKFHSLIPYWPKGAIKGRTKHQNWEVEVELLNRISNDELAHLKILSIQAGKELEGRWSLDWMFADEKRGWVAIDMAVAEMSWGCPKEWQKVRK